MLETARPATEYTTKDGLASPVVHSLFEDSRGDVWISTMSSTGNGLARWNHATRTVHDMAYSEGLPPLKDRLPCAFEEDRSGGVWIGLSRGELHDTPPIVSGSSPRMMGCPTERSPTCTSIAVAGCGSARRAAASRAWTIRRRRVLTFVVYSAVQGLSSNRVTAITDDLYGRIYVATGRGLDRLSPGTGQVRHFTSADGFPPGEVHAAYREDNGALWFGTRSGLLRYVPEPERRSQQPSVFITGLRIAGERRDISALGETDITLGDLDADRNHVQLDFVALSFATGETMRYEYKLDPGDNWSAPSDQRTLNFANLAPGRYQFVVRAINIGRHRQCDDQPASASPSWRPCGSGGGSVVGALTAGLIAYSLYRYRLWRLLELERVRTRIATDLHDEIGSNLSLIAMVSEVANRTAQTGRPASSLLAVTHREHIA